MTPWRLSPHPSATLKSVCSYLYRLHFLPLLVQYRWQSVPGADAELSWRHCGDSGHTATGRDAISGQVRDAVQRERRAFPVPTGHGHRPANCLQSGPTGRHYLATDTSVQHFVHSTGWRRYVFQIVVTLREKVLSIPWHHVCICINCFSNEALVSVSNNFTCMIIIIRIRRKFITRA